MKLSSRSFLLLFTLTGSLSQAAPLNRSTITQVVNEAAIIQPGTTSEMKAQVQGVFTSSDVLRTGRASRVEMVAEDQTVTRVGANALFRFEPKSREINLQRGSVLFNSPAGRGGGTIKTAAATASVLGTTLIVAATSNGGFKVLVLEGKGKVKMARGGSRTLKAGQLTFVLPGQTFGPVMNFQLQQQVAGSGLVNGFKRPLPSLEKIQNAIAQQEEKLEKGGLSETGVLAGDSPTEGYSVDSVATEALLEDGQDGDFDGEFDDEEEDEDSEDEDGEDEEGDDEMDEDEDADGDDADGEDMDEVDGGDSGVDEGGDGGVDGGAETARILKKKRALALQAQRQQQRQAGERAKAKQLASRAKAPSKEAGVIKARPPKRTVDPETGAIQFRHRDTLNVSNTQLPLRDVSMQARTINLRDVGFAEGSRVTLDSARGELAPKPNTGQPSKPGFVNFIKDVRYGSRPAEEAVGKGITIK